MIITVQAKREKPEEIAKLCEKEGLKHIYIELNGASEAILTDPDTVTHLQKKFKNIFQRLHAEKHIAVVHCSAGLHRTGTTGYTLLRLQGLDANEAYNGLKTMR